MNFNHWATAEILLLLTACCVFWKPINAADEFSSQTVTVVGRVFCDTCFHRKLTTTSHFIPGASVAVGCNIKGDVRAALKSKAEGKTNEGGFYRIKIPVRFRSEKDIEKCSVQLVRSSIIWCSVPFIRNRSRLVIKSEIKDGYLYRAGPLSFRPPRLPGFCKTKPQDGFTSSKFDFPPISFPFPFPFPPISLPYPPIPPIGFPLPPFWDLPPIPFWPPLPDVGVPPPPPPDPTGSGGSAPPPPPPPPPLPNVNPPTPTLPTVHYIPPPPPPPPPLASPPSFQSSP